MLKSLLIQNFKPIVDSGELKLAPVTILAGRNSSGKSSLIQAILMIAQTLSNRVLDRALLPNGPMVQLGTFEDILSELTDLREIVIGFELEGKKENDRILGRRGRKGQINVYNVDIDSINVKSVFRSASNNSTRTSAIEASRVNVERVYLEVTTSHKQLPSSQAVFFPETENEVQFDFCLDIKRLMPIDNAEFLKDISPEYLRFVPYANNNPNYLGAFRSKEESKSALFPKPSLVAFSHFLPMRLIRKYSIVERYKKQAIQIVELMLEKTGAAYLLDNEMLRITSHFIVSRLLKEYINNICKRMGFPERFDGDTISDLIEWHIALEYIKRGEISGEKGFVDHVVKDMNIQSYRIGAYRNALEMIVGNPYVEVLDDAVEHINRFFTSKIRYLGPLRADPQAAQKFAPSSELDDVGAKGEYAAAVYDANQEAVIQWFDPFEKKIERSALKIALNTWVRYLGLVNEVHSQMAGQSGVSWLVVHQEGRKALPLASVGVGVSQILPILVMGLLAPSDTLLLVEQPELHLHPSVQARLGDFFMGLEKCNKQCLIETHSDNLVNQLRYHIVQAGGQEHSPCQVYFVDQDQRGATQFTPIEISPKGNILNWPDGFLDETMLQEDKITAAGMRKEQKK